MSLSPKEELELLELEEQEYKFQKSAKSKSMGKPGQGKSMLGDIGDYALRGLDYAGGIARTAGAELGDAFVDGNKVSSKDWEKAFKGKAPTSSEYMDRLGVPEGFRVNLMPEVNIPGTDITLGKGDSSVRDIGGFALDVASDPLTYMTLGVASKPTREAIKSTGKAIGKSIGATSKSGSSVLSKTAEALTAAPKKSIEVYANRTEELNNIFKKYSGDIAEFTDDIKSNWNKEIQSTKNSLNKSIDETIESMPDSKVIDIGSIKNQLNKEKYKLNKVLEEDAVSDINEYINKLNILSDNDRISVKDLNDVKKYFQAQSKGSYKKEGQIFSRSKRGQRAAKSAARIARKQLNDISPDIAKANNSLSRLHSLEDTMNRNILKEGGAYNAVKTAGSGANSRNRKQIKELSEITGKDMLKDAENVAAMDVFANPSLLPMDTTGKSVARTGAAYLIGGLPAAIMTSPLTLKAAINAGKVPRSIGKMFGGSGNKVKDAAKIYINMVSSNGQKALEKLGRAARVAYVHGAKEKTSLLSNHENEDKDYFSKLKGRSKWAFDGYVNLLSQTEDKYLINNQRINKIFSNPKSRKLLISASSLNSKDALQKVLNKIKELEEK